MKVKENLLRCNYFGTHLLISWCETLLLALTWPEQDYSWGSGAAVSKFVIMGVFFSVDRMELFLLLKSIGSPKTCHLKRSIDCRGLY